MASRCFGVYMAGAIRTYDDKVRAQVGRDVKPSIEKIAERAGATAEVLVVPAYSTTLNDEKLATRMAPVLKRATSGKVATAPLVGASEGFSFFYRQVPGLYFFLGITPAGQDPASAAPNHNPDFFVDKSALIVGTWAMSAAPINFLGAGK